jgi:hypothetical protein
LSDAVRAVDSLRLDGGFHQWENILGGEIRRAHRLQAYQKQLVIGISLKRSTLAVLGLTIQILIAHAGGIELLPQASRLVNCENTALCPSAIPGELWNSASNFALDWLARFGSSKPMASGRPPQQPETAPSTGHSRPMRPADLPVGCGALYSVRASNSQ